MFKELPMGQYDWFDEVDMPWWLPHLFADAAEIDVAAGQLVGEGDEEGDEKLEGSTAPEGPDIEEKVNSV